jgi:predicted RNA-binding Zn-ribbon protein involved in translation (DUF1610 family)
MPVDRSRVHARSTVRCSACGAHVLRIAAMPPGKSAVWFKCPVCHTRAQAVEVKRYPQESTP